MQPMSVSWLGLVGVVFAALPAASAAEGPQRVAAPTVRRGPAALDLREPMALAAHAVARRLDPAQNGRPWFMLRGKSGIPVAPHHDTWDFGDMTGRYLEGLIFARQMGIVAPDLAEAEDRLGRYLLSLLGPNGLVHSPDSGAIDHTFSQGSALGGLVAWYEDSGDPAVRRAAERLITGLLQRFQKKGDQLVDPSVKLEQSCGSHLAGYAILPAIRFYEQTGYADALTLSEGLSRWVLADPVLGADGTITKPLSWEGHIHSWCEALAGCARTARRCKSLDRGNVTARAKALYDWVRRTNGTSFGWIATFPTHGSCETCGIASALRLARELVESGHEQYLGDIERFVRNQVVEAQFRDLDAYRGGPPPPTPLLVGCFDSQSLPNGHLGTRGGDEVGNVEGCCVSGGMRALALAWQMSQTFDESGATVHLSLSRDGPAARVVGFQPAEGRVDVIPRAPGTIRVRVPDWAPRERVALSIDGAPAKFAWSGRLVVVDNAKAGATIAVRYPLRDLVEQVNAGGKSYRATWKGDVVVDMSPKGSREPTYQNRLGGAPSAATPAAQRVVPDRFEVQDAARLASHAMVGRMDLARGGQPFFRIYPFAKPPYAEHQKWDDGDMTGRYVEGLIVARRMTGIPMDPRETLLRGYLTGLFDAQDGLCYTRAAAWTPRRACLFSQSTAMMGLLEWHRETGSPEARRLLDRHADGLIRIAVAGGNHVRFPRYEWDGKQFVDEPKGQEVPAWYGGRTILPLVDYWQLSGRADVRDFLEKLIRYTTEVSTLVRADGEVERGPGWWGHLHSIHDMAAGICEFGRLTGRRDLVAWARRLYDWTGRTQATRYGFVADVSGGTICESCAITSRIRLGLALYRAGAVADPFDEIDRYVRNQLLETQFVDVSFLSPQSPEKPRTEQHAYAGLDRMIRGTFQCWGAANDLIGHDEIEGCGAGGGTQGLALAWDGQYEWRDRPGGQELRVHLLWNRTVRGPAAGGLTRGTPPAAIVASALPQEGRVSVSALRALPRLTLRIPDGGDVAAALVRRVAPDSTTAAATPAARDGRYAVFESIKPGERVELEFPLRRYETEETAAGRRYRAAWKGNAVRRLDPPGQKIPLYAGRDRWLDQPTPYTAPRYP